MNQVGGNMPASSNRSNWPVIGFGIAAALAGALPLALGCWMPVGVTVYWFATFGQWLSAVFTGLAVLGAWLAYHAQSEQIRILRKEHSLENYKWRSDLIHQLANEIMGVNKRGEGLEMIKKVLKKDGKVPPSLPICAQRKWDRFIWIANDLYGDYVTNGLRPILGGPLERLGDAIREGNPKLDVLRNAVVREQPGAAPVPANPAATVAL